MKIKTKKFLKITIYLILLIYAVIVVFNIPMIQSSPDSKLYLGLAENIKSGTGYYDNIRNQDILPPIGHPLLLCVFSLFSNNVAVFTRLFIFISLLLLSLAAHKTLKTIWAIGVSFLFPLLVWVPGVWIAGGVESSIIFINSLLIYIFVNIFTSAEPVPDYKYILAGFIIFLSLIIRPILWIGVILALCVFILVFLKIRKKSILKRIIFLLIFPIILYQSVGFISVGLYRDKRLTNGTYSGITLYSAYNEYINLERSYGSRLFKDKPEAEVNIHYADETWQERNARLIGASINFVKKHPIRAIRGYLWRLGAFTFNNPYIQYKIMVLIWIVHFFLSVKYIKKYPWIIAFAFLLPIYYLGITSIFVYVGARYLIAMIPIFFGSVLLQNRVILMNSKKTKRL